MDNFTFAERIQTSSIPCESRFTLFILHAADVLNIMTLFKETPCRLSPVAGAAFSPDLRTEAALTVGYA